MALLIKRPNQILTDMLTTLKAGLLDIGIDNPQVDEGSDYYIMFSAIANELAVAEQNINLASEALMPDSAVGTDLDRILNNYGLSRRSASTANGSIILTSSLTTVVPTGSQLISNIGSVYQVTVGGSYANLAEIPVESISTGEGVNLDSGEVLTWISTPAFAQSTCVVGKDITGGVAAEDDSTARNRLLAKMQNPPALGNWQQVAELCEKMDPIVQKAFIYPCCNGPSTMHIALTSAPTVVSQTREISDVKMLALENAIKGQLPEYVDSYISTVIDTPVDVAFKLSLPYPLGSISLGTGGGWVDAQPFPVVSETVPYARVIPLTSTSFVILVEEEDPIPILNTTSISWIDKADYKVKTATIIAATYTADALFNSYLVVIDTPFVGIAYGDYVFPTCTNAQTYVNAVLSHFSRMGPGEKSAVASLLPRAYRKPRPNLSYPSSLDGKMLRAITNSSSEVLTADYWYSTYGTDSPVISASVESPPLIYTPGSIAFYPEEI